MDTEERIFQRIDKFEERLDDTCNRIEKIDSYITLERENSERKFNRSVSVLGAIIGVIGLISILDYIP
jgi:hypothetical protein